jgi:phosphoribosylformylglycinamidine synthase subunit PurSL
VGGAFLFDESYRGKPLVFCGTGGILPREIAGEGSWIKHIDDGDITVMVGGRIGKDGIHGATFSSLALDEESPTSAVQIGDPITQKKMADFLLEARDKGLYKGITDNGAGGLSSSLGEMAEYSGGIRVDLNKCPLKYPGLAPWEIWVSESQERMSLAVDPATLDELLALARKRDVEATPIGEFTSTGTVSLYYEGQLAGEISLDFLHDGLPVMTIPAELNQLPAVEKTLTPPGEGETEGLLYALLAEPNIASKEPLVRQYDHEVQIQSVTKPFVGTRSDGPSDGAVLRPVARSYRGVTVTHGICPWYAPLNAYRMAQNAVDEAFRAHIALGGDPDQTSVLDNFCWPDPVESVSTPDGPHKMAQLVQTCRGLQDACLAYKAPLISGKDSMKNDAQLGGKKVSVKPTLLVSLMGITPDCRKTPSTDFKSPGDLIYLLGETRGELGGTFYEKLGGKGPLGSCPEVKPEEALPLYRSLHRAIHRGLTASCHDLSDGGLGVALAESALAGRLGAEIDLAMVPCGPRCGDEAERLLFCETPSRFLVSVAPENRGSFEETLTGRRFALIGSVTASPWITVTKDGAGIVSVPLDRVTNAWKKPFGGEVE